MGALVGVATILFLFAVGIAGYIQSFVYNEQKGSIYISDTDKALSIAKSGLYIARDSLNADTDLTDCTGVDRNCNSADNIGYFILYSPSLNKDIQDFQTNDGTLTLWMKPVSNNEIKVVSRGYYKGKEVYIGAKFVRGYSMVDLPVSYGGLSTNIIGGTLCSYFWDGSKVAGVTLPNLDVYLTTNFYVSANILVPDNPAGNNPKDVFFGTDFDTEVRGYDVIDRLYSTGDIYVRWFSHIGTAKSNKNVYVDWFSSVDKIIENSNWVYPSFNRTLNNNGTNLQGTGTSLGDAICDASNPNLVLQTGRYRDITVTADCQKITLQGDKIYLRNLTVENGANISIQTTEPNTELIVSQYITNNGVVNVDTSGGDIKVLGDIFDNGSCVKKKKKNKWKCYKGEFYCDDPRKCLVDVNDFNNRGTLQSILIGRKTVTGFNGSTFIGNIVAEDLYTQNSTVCNIVDSEGRQIVNDSVYADTIYSLSNPVGGDFVLNAVLQTLCSGLVDCDALLN